MRDASDLREARQANRSLEMRLTGRPETGASDANTDDIESFARVLMSEHGGPLHLAASILQSIQSELRGSTVRESVARLLDGCTAEIQEAGKMVNALVAYVRVGVDEMEPTMCDPTMLAHAVIDDLLPAPSHQRVHWTVDPMPPLYGDPAMLRHVYDTLLSNALKFSRQAASAEIHVGSTTSGRQQVYFVQDNGRGFSASSCERLFKPFGRLHVEEGFEGIGINLAMSRRIIRRHGGWIWAEAAPGRGSSFFFTIPPR
jgi:light-regulated signal transduction histidine kinase (bacteriophytochrome)